MLETTFISNKARKETIKYIFVFIFALIAWILQVSVFSKLFFFDANPNIILLSTIYFGLTGGPIVGSISGIISSFLITSTIYDHIYYISFPIIGFLSGLSIKNTFSDELLFFILSSFLFTFFVELLNGMQYSSNHPINIIDRYLVVSFNGAILNLCLSPFFYYFINYVTNKLNLRQSHYL